MTPLTPPLTPATRAQSPALPHIHPPRRPRGKSPLQNAITGLATPPISPDFALPPPIASLPMPDLDLGAASLPLQRDGSGPMDPMQAINETNPAADAEGFAWRRDMTEEERDAREAWISEGRGRTGLRIVIVTENFLPKVDGVTRTLARLLEHLEREGHQCMLLGPGTGMSHYASHPLVGTAGVPLVVYPGLKLNFLRPKFLRTIRDFQPDVVHFVDPIWLGAQTLMAMELGWAGEDWVAEEGPALGSGIRGAVVASYHTNLATYATLFGMAWLEPIMWKFQRWLYSKTLITLCPSPSTLNMLEGQSFAGVRLWPRGVDLSQFGPDKRSVAMRAMWGVGEAPKAVPPKVLDMGVNHQGRKVSLPLTPPASPWVAPVQGEVYGEPDAMTLSQRVVLLYVGRISWEKNLHLLLAAYKRLPAHLPAGHMPPKLVFVGDGPARVELEAICQKEGHDAVFMGHRSGAELAACYASADVFAFPSFTETFGQVVLEALASGLPVVGLDAEGTRDLVSHARTGLLLPLPHKAVTGENPSRTWPTICRDHSTEIFAECAEGYASLLGQAVLDHDARRGMGTTASTEGIVGYTWWDAMERCVDGYRESIRQARQGKSISVVVQQPDEAPVAPVTSMSPGSPGSRISRVNRALSRRLAKGKWPEHERSEEVVRRGLLRRVKGDTSESVWHLKTLFKAVFVLAVFYAIWSHHIASKARNMPFAEAADALMA